jgi:hypothetical protein
MHHCTLLPYDARKRSIRFASNISEVVIVESYLATISEDEKQTTDQKRREFVKIQSERQGHRGRKSTVQRTSIVLTTLTR